MLRTQGKCKLLEDHPVITQTNHVKERYMKLAKTIAERDGKETEHERNRIDKEATKRIIKNALGSQIEMDKIKSQSLLDEGKSKKKKNYMSSSSDSDSGSDSPDKKSKKKTEKLT